ncbi:hypothetical protein [Pedobacter sp. SYP-B3415]|uniref:hypothetical protein n=1 Tax=Pedobacter sp. SYP-B3415 TaxID=2496641 RepID=UPI00101BFE5B|nr:hypothetical protein [Pedobacter sp. SYP-B3415]
MKKPLNDPDKQKAIENNSFRQQLDEETAKIRGPRDGYDNTGTQGYDSLSDEGYTGERQPDGGPQSHTGSSSEDFDNEKFKDRDREDKALDSGI